jgi:hypothetical protein
MNCKKAQNLFMEMDNRESLPVPLSVHMFLCPRCRHMVKTLGESLASLQQDAPFAMRYDLSDQIMKSVLNSDMRYEHNVSIFKWTAAGSLILMSMALIPFSNSFEWLRRYFGTGLELPMSIVLGMILSTYASIAIFSNMEELKKFIQDYQRKIH